MEKRDKLHWRLLTCDVAYVLDYFDEEHLIPWNFVKRKQGQFEGIATVLLDGKDGEHGEAVEVSVGVFDGIDQAAVEVRKYNMWLDAVKKLTFDWRDVFTEVEV